MKLEKVVLLDEALEDLEAGRRFYDDQEDGVGVYFVNSLLSDISSLALYSGIHSSHYGYFRMLSKRFPFAIYYEVVGELTRIVAVLDMRQNPGNIRSALSRRDNR
jgi:plasmid stabilization system protein ParE